MSSDAESFEKHLNGLLTEGKINQAFYNLIRSNIGQFSSISKDTGLTGQKRPSFNLLISMIAYSQINETTQQLRSTEDDLKNFADKWNKKKIDENTAKKKMKELTLTENQLKQHLETLYKLSEFPLEIHARKLSDLERKRKKAERVYEKKRLTKKKYEQVVSKLNKMQQENIKAIKAVLEPLRTDLEYFNDIATFREKNSITTDQSLVLYIQNLRNQLTEIEEKYPELQKPKYTVNDFLNEMYSEIEQIPFRKITSNLHLVDSRSIGQTIIELPSESSFEVVSQVIPSEPEGVTIFPEEGVEPTLRYINDPWEPTGQVLLDSQDTLLGICGEPVIYQNKTYIPVSKEVEIGMELTDRIFRDVQSLTITQEVATSETRQNLIRAQIVEALNIRPEIALYPTTIMEFCARKKIPIPPTLKIEKKATKYFPLENIVRIPESLNFRAIDDFYQRALDQMFLAPSPQDIRKADLIGKPIRKWTQESIGTVRDVINHPLSQKLCVVELFTPSEVFLSSIQQKVLDPQDKDKGLWYLRFVISKTLGISDGESLDIEPLWKFCWKRKYPLLPWELEASYTGLTSIGAIQMMENWILLKRSVVIRPLGEIYFLPRKGILVNSSSGEEEGIILGLSYNKIQKKLSLLYTPKSLEEILEALGRTPTTTYLQKLKKRIAKALDIPIDYGLDLDAVIKYFINFVPFVEDLSLIHKAKKWIHGIVDQKTIPLDSIVQINQNNIIANL